MICDFCSHEIADVDVIEARDIRRIPAWCNHCGAFSNGKDRMRLPHLGICLSMDRTYEEARKKMEGPHFCNKPKGHEGDHECVVGDHLLGRWSQGVEPDSKWPSTEELIARMFPELSLLAASVVERFLKDREAHEETTTERAYRLATSFYDDMQGRCFGSDKTTLSKNEVKAPFVYHLALLLKKRIEEGNTYRDTCKSAQEAGTKLWNKVVRVKNLLRVAQPYLEQDNMRCPDELELAALCNQIEKEIGSLEDNTTAEDGRKVAERLGIDIEKWAEELRAKVDAATKEGAGDQKEDT